jgi:hypothetical protein
VAVIIGSSTLVTLDFPGGTINGSEGVSSVDWSYGTNVQRLYTLGMGVGACGPNEFGAIRSAEINVNFSIYGGVTPETSVCPLAECSDSPASVVVNIVPGACDETVGSLSKQVFINSYSYSKDKTGVGVETYAGNAYMSVDDLEQQGGCDNICLEPEPTYVILGVAEGTIESEIDDAEAIVGAYFRDDACVVNTSKASVQAGPTSVGEYMITKHGTFQSIGNSQFCVPGVLARASVSLQLTPVYLGT